MEDNKELYALIRQLYKTLKKHGVKKVINAIKKINYTEHEVEKWNLIDFIEDCVCNHIGVPKSELYIFKTRGEVTIARNISVVLIRKYVPKISDENLASRYNRSRQIVHNAQKDFRKLKLGKLNKFEMDVLKIYQEVEEKIKDFIKIKN